MTLRPKSQPQSLKQTFGGYQSTSSRPKTQSDAPLWRQSSRDFIDRSKVKTRAPGNGPHFDESLGRYSAWPSGTKDWYRSINNNVNDRPNSKAARLSSTRSMKDNMDDHPDSKAARLRSMKMQLGNLRNSQLPHRNKAPQLKTLSRTSLSRKKATRAPGNGPHRDESLGGTVYRGNAGTRDWYKSINNNCRPRTTAGPEMKAQHVGW